MPTPACRSPPATRWSRRSGRSPSRPRGRAPNAELGGFGGFFDLKAAGYRDPLLVAANDGVGTKLKLAIDTGRHDGVGIDLVAMCANDLIVQGAEPLFFLDYYATGKLDNDVAAAVVASIAEGCRQAGCALIGGETAEMPGMYAERRLRPRRLLRRRGRARQGADRRRNRARRRHPRPRQLGRPLQRLLAGPPDHRRARAGSSTEPLPSTGRATLGELLLEPTRIYVASLLPLVQRGRIKGLAHITGGGLLENIPRVLPEDCHADRRCRCLAPAARCSRSSRTAAQIAPEEMARTFNCGIGMVVDRRARTRPTKSPRRLRQRARPCSRSAASKPARAAARSTGSAGTWNSAGGLVRDPSCVIPAEWRS